MQGAVAQFRPRPPARFSLDLNLRSATRHGERELRGFTLRWSERMVEITYSAAEIPNCLWLMKRHTLTSLVFSSDGINPLSTINFMGCSAQLRHGQYRRSQ